MGEPRFGKGQAQIHVTPSLDQLEFGPKSKTQNWSLKGLEVGLGKPRLRVVAICEASARRACGETRFDSAERKLGTSSDRPWINLVEGPPLLDCMDLQKV